MADQAPDDQLADFEREAMPHWNDLYRTAVRLLQDGSKACDAVQESYLLAWRSFHRYQRGSNCKAWLYQILFNVVRHERRTWFKRLTGKEDDIALADVIAPPPVPVEISDQDILSALDRLPMPFRSVLLLVDVEEFSYKEVSTMLKVPIGTVMSRVSRARAILRQRLAGVSAAYGVTSRHSRERRAGLGGEVGQE